MLAWFAETTLVAAALAAVAALASRARGIGPAARHLLWLAVLVKLMTPPLVCWPWAAPLFWTVPKPPAAAVARVEPMSTRNQTVIPVAVALDAADGDRTAAPGAPATGLRSARGETAFSETAPVAEPVLARSRPAAALGLSLEETLIGAWLMVTALVAVGQAWRISRFARRLRLAVPAPDDLVAETRCVAARLGVSAPELLVVADLGSPILWCLGRPRLLIPAALFKTLEPGRWRGILAHELAHLRRGDHWVSRLELAAGLIWWWNPLYWLARARLDAEAELACDAWVVWVLPDDRLAYAETLFDIGSSLSRAVTPAPALGAAGSGRLLERRLTMILRERVSSRLSPMGLVAFGLLVLLSLPSWSSAVVPAIAPMSAPARSEVVPARTAVDDDDLADDDDADDDDADDDDADDDDNAVSKARKEAKARARDARAKARDQAKIKAKDGARTSKKSDLDVDIDDILGPEFEKKMEAIGERIEKELEAKLGPGSEFEKRMEAMGKELEAKLGPGSAFEARMKTLGKELEAKFGPGSDFERKMKALGDEIQDAVAAGVPGQESSRIERLKAERNLERAQEIHEWSKKMKEKGYLSKQQADDAEFKLKLARAAMEELENRKTAADPTLSRKAGNESGKLAGHGQAAPKGDATKLERKARIEAIEAQIRKLSKELEALEADDDLHEANDHPRNKD